MHVGGHRLAAAGDDVDADIGFEPEAALRLLLAGRDVVAGVYPHKMDAWPAQGLAQALPAGSTREDFEARYPSFPANRLSHRPVDADGFMEVLDAPTGFMLIARDVNRLLRDMPSGRLWPTNVVKLVLGTQKILSGRVVLLGLKTEYRNRGLFPLFAYEAARRALEIRAEGAEASWILDDNESIVAPLEAMGLAAYKRWRIYEK